MDLFREFLDERWFDSATPPSRDVRALVVDALSFKMPNLLAPIKGPSSTESQMGSTAADVPMDEQAHDAPPSNLPTESESSGPTGTTAVNDTASAPSSTTSAQPPLNQPPKLPQRSRSSSCFRAGWFEEAYRLNEEKMYADRNPVDNRFGCEIPELWPPLNVTGGSIDQPESEEAVLILQPDRYQLQADAVGHPARLSGSVVVKLHHSQHVRDPDIAFKTSYLCESDYDSALTPHHYTPFRQNLERSGRDRNHRYPYNDAPKFIEEYRLRVGIHHKDMNPSEKKLATQRFRDELVMVCVIHSLDGVRHDYELGGFEWYFTIIQVVHTHHFDKAITACIMRYEPIPLGNHRFTVRLFDRPKRSYVDALDQLIYYTFDELRSKAQAAWWQTVGASRAEFDCYGSQDMHPHDPVRRNRGVVAPEQIQKQLTKMVDNMALHEAPNVHNWNSPFRYDGYVLPPPKRPFYRPPHFD